MCKGMIKFLLLSLCLMGIAQADTVIYNSQATWLSNVGGVVNRDFNSLPSNGTFLGSGYTNNGVTFSETNNYLFTWGPGTGQDLGTGTYLLAGSWPDSLTTTLATPASAFGLNLALDDSTLNQYSSNYYPHTLAVTINFQNGPAESYTVNFSNAAGGPFPSGFDFFGVTAGESNKITSVTFAMPNLYPQYYCDPSRCYNGLSGPNLFVDNVQTATATPEPGSLVLLGSGFLGLCGAIRRKLIA